MLDPDQSRQALRPARTGQEAELDLREAEFGIGAGNAIVRAHGELEPAAKTGAGDRRDDRLAARLYGLDEPAQRGLCRARGRAELADVGAAGEETAAAGQDDRADGGVVLRALERGGDAGADGVRETVDGGIGERDDRDGAVDSVVDVRHALKGHQKGLRRKTGPERHDRLRMTGSVHRCSY